MVKVKQKLQEKIYTILCRDWNPIGIYKDGSEWDDEYTTYIPAVVRCLMSSDDPKKVQNLLENISKNSMGITFKNERARIAALALMEKKREFYC